MADKLKVVSPFNEELIKEIDLDNESRVEEALETAFGLSNERASWIPQYRRIEILERTAEIMLVRLSWVQDYQALYT